MSCPRQSRTISKTTRAFCRKSVVLATSIRRGWPAQAAAIFASNAAACSADSTRKGLLWSNPCSNAGVRRCTTAEYRRNSAYGCVSREASSPLGFVASRPHRRSSHDRRARLRSRSRGRAPRPPSRAAGGRSRAARRTSPRAFSSGTRTRCRGTRRTRPAGRQTERRWCETRPVESGSFSS